MSREQFTGQVREIVNALSGALIAWGILNDERAASLGGVIVCLAVFFWGVNEKEGAAFLASSLRKICGALGGAAVAFGVMTPDKAEALLGVVGPVLAMGFSLRSHGGSKSTGRFPVVVFLAVLAMALSACGAVEVNIPVSGEYVAGEIKLNFGGK